MKTKTKKILGGTVAAALVTALAVGGTMAYLTNETERRVNKFTFANHDEVLNAMLIEPDWDGVIDYAYSEDGTITPIYEYRDVNGDGNKVPVYGYSNGDYSKPVTNIADATDTTTTRSKTNSDGTIRTYGIEQAEKMIPGSTAKKNPIITNTGVQSDAWVAAKITFIYASGDNAGKPLSTTDMATLNDIIIIEYNDTKWEEIADATLPSTSKVFYYKEVLDMDTDETAGVYGESTDPLFTAVSVNLEATNDQIDALHSIGGFDIYIEGFAVQSIVGIDDDGEESYTLFKAWGQAGGVNFSNTPTDTAPANVNSTIIG